MAMRVKKNNRLNQAKYSRFHTRKRIVAIRDSNGMNKLTNNFNKQCIVHPFLIHSSMVYKGTTVK